MQSTPVDVVLTAHPRANLRSPDSARARATRTPVAAAGTCRKRRHLSQTPVVSHACPELRKCALTLYRKFICNAPKTNCARLLAFAGLLSDPRPLARSSRRPPALHRSNSLTLRRAHLPLTLGVCVGGMGPSAERTRPLARFANSPSDLLRSLPPP
eukprot:IDg14973t1